MDESKRSELEKKFFLYQFLKSQLETLHTNFEAVSNRVVEMTMTMHALGELSNSKGGDDILVPLGPGVFMPAKAGKVEKVIFNYGADTMVEKNISEASAKIAERLKELHGMQNDMGAQIQSVTAQLQALGPELEAMAQDADKRRD